MCKKILISILIILVIAGGVFGIDYLIIHPVEVKIIQVEDLIDDTMEVLSFEDMEEGNILNLDIFGDEEPSKKPEDYRHVFLSINFKCHSIRDFEDYEATITDIDPELDKYVVLKSVETIYGETYTFSSVRFFDVNPWVQMFIYVGDCKNKNEADERVKGIVNSCTIKAAYKLEGKEAEIKKLKVPSDVEWVFSDEREEE